MSTDLQVSELPESETLRLIEWLASFGETKEGGATRLLYSDSWLEAQRGIFETFRDRGLTPFFDDAGNLYGRVEGTQQTSSAVVTGSHIDTVVNGGKYDGTYGIVASYLAVTRLMEAYGPPKKTIDVVSLCEEEGSRFPITFWGSGHITGQYAGEDPKDYIDKEGVSLETAMHKAGFGKNQYPAPHRSDIECFVEMHIEQGHVLEKNGCSVGVVEGIVGQRRYHIHVKGESNHAGTTPMTFRKDAMAAASEMIHWIHQEAFTDDHLVATVGQIEARPNTANVIAGDVVFSLDIRHHRQDVLDAFCSSVFTQLEETAEQNGVSMQASKWLDVSPVSMDPGLTRRALEQCSMHSIPTHPMFSGAGHDAQVFGNHFPTSLLFVPSQNGISHSPQEFTCREDLEKGVRMMTEFLYTIAW
ncbi:Zn-dependent hydrolase [Salibacterium lacus]|uniref:Zn-dependent hydrolase n=1 Tax=Salibacterium lacus TaxID=1898109 RepID=A0ABW5T2T3_9BACI